MIRRNALMLSVIFVTMFMLSCNKDDKEETIFDPNLKIGAYYFDGWAGRSYLADDPDEPWAANAPSHLTRRMLEEFPEREPVWGWRDDSLEIMERQIDLAADHGLAFFAFCWYWHDNQQAINVQAILDDSKFTGLELFLQARNNHRMKFCLLIANHDWYEITGTENWTSAGEFLMPYLTHEQYLTVDSMPLIIIFDAAGGDRNGFVAMQQMAQNAGLSGLAIAANWNGSPADGYTHRTHYAIAQGWEGGSEEHSYSELIAANKEQWYGTAAQPYIPIVTSGWDRRPWEGPDGLYNQAASWYYPDRTPEQFAGLLQDAVTWMDNNPGQTTKERIVMVYAWNEFGEGGYIAPTVGDPEGEYLKAIKSAAILKP